MVFLWVGFMIAGPIIGVAFLQDAYGFVLASNYNARPRAAEVLVEGDRWRIIRDRESLDDLIRGERT